MARTGARKRSPKWQVALVIMITSTTYIDEEKKNEKDEDDEDNDLKEEVAQMISVKENYLKEKEMKKLGILLLAVFGLGLAFQSCNNHKTYAEMKEEEREAKLEELRKDGSEEAMIEAGKILVEEIMFNTDDKMGIINEEDSVNNK